jgi:2-phospho-L-lactate guanylyltransferase
MLKDVTSALNLCRAADRIVVVTRDPWVRDYAAAQHWDVLLEDHQVSESDSVDRASAILRLQGVQTVLRIPGDIPLVQPEDLDFLLTMEVSAPGAVLVPSQDRTGTNALLRTPPDIFPSRFGRNSCFLHQEEARRVGAAMAVIENSRISLDIDEPADILEFCKRGKGTATFEALEALARARRSKLRHQRLTIA